MLQVETTPDSSFFFLAADTSAAAHEKNYSTAPATHTSGTSSLHHPTSAHMSTSNQWQPPAWHHHHSRHMSAPSTSAAHLPAPYSTHPARSANSSPIPADHGAPHGHAHDDQRYGSSYSSNGGDYGHPAYESYQQRDHYYASESQWSYPADQQHHQQHPQQQQHHHTSQSHGASVYGGKPTTDSMGIAIDPLPLRHLVQTTTVQGIPNPNGTVEQELYEAHMLQEALTTPHYTRAHLGGFHHQHQLPAHLQQHQQHHHQGGQPPQYSSPFVSAVIDASAPMHHHHSSGPHGLHLARQSSSAATTSEHTTPSDSDNGGDLKANAAGKRKRRGESAPRLCRVEGCSKGIRSRGLCKAHGGGRRCMTPGCTTSDQGGGHCVLHGGGRRCTVENCTKSAQWKGLCKMHGGARRCRYQNCTKNGQVKAGYCRAHHNLITKQREQGIIEA